MQKNESGLLPYTTTEITQKMDYNLNVKPETVKLLE